MNGKTNDADVEKIVKKLNELEHEVHIGVHKIKGSEGIF